MDVSFHRYDGRAYSALARRGDGVSVRLDGSSYDRSQPPLPHDLAHFVVEDELKLTAGLWGVIAAGGLFAQVSVVAGRQRPHAAERGREVIKRAGDRISTAEVLVRVLGEIARAGEERSPAVVDRIPGRRRPQDLGPQDVQRTCERLRQSARQWSAVAHGESLDLVWCAPLDASLAGRPHETRRKRRAGSGSRR